MRQFLHLKIGSLREGARLRLLRIITASEVATTVALLVTALAPLAAPLRRLCSHR